MYTKLIEPFPQFNVLVDCLLDFSPRLNLTNAPCDCFVENLLLVLANGTFGRIALRLFA